MDFGAEGTMSVSEWMNRHPGIRIGRFLQGKPTDTEPSKGVGAYPTFAEMIIELAEKQRILPNQVQATLRKTMMREVT